MAMLCRLSRVSALCAPLLAIATLPVHTGCGFETSGASDAVGDDTGADAEPDGGVEPAPPEPGCEPAPGDGLGEVATHEGSVRGILNDDTWAFLGIPYAAPPLGDGRFRPPSPPACRDRVLDASGFPPACPQLSWSDEEQSPRFLGSEDCLYLNVWRPAAEAAPRPVVVFLHGGGNQEGASTQVEFGARVLNGARLALNQDLVVVTVNYRLGALGFLAHPALSKEAEGAGSGNYGLLDQVEALRWVRDNIAAFSGDPERILLVGQGAGADNVCALLGAPAARGLFHAAALHSGSCRARSLAEAEAVGQEVAAAAGCGDSEAPADCLRSVAPSELVAVTPRVFTDGRATSAFGPVVDAQLLRKEPLESLRLGEAAPVPLVVGANADEAGLLVPFETVTPAAWDGALVEFFEEPFLAQARALYPPGESDGAARAASVAFFSDGQFICPARRIARAALAGTERVWRYHFTHRPGGLLGLITGSFHGLELFYLFGGFTDIQDYVPTPEDEAVASAVQTMWGQFARAGAPAAEDSWPTYEPAQDAHLRIAPEPAPGARVRTAACDFWDALAERSASFRGSGDDPGHLCARCGTSCVNRRGCR